MLLFGADFNGIPGLPRLIRVSLAVRANASLRATPMTEGARKQRRIGAVRAPAREGGALWEEHPCSSVFSCGSISR
jgi:hypothetical protein